MGQTRVNYNIVNSRGTVVWTIGATSLPKSTRFQRMLIDNGYSIERPTGKKVIYKGPMFSHSDPESSVRAAIEAADRVDNMRNRLLLHFIRYNGKWQTRDRVRLIGGDQGDRRARELRDEGDWPIEIKQFHDGEPWRYRLNLDPASMAAARRELGLDA